MSVITSDVDGTIVSKENLWANILKANIVFKITTGFREEGDIRVLAKETRKPYSVFTN